MGCGTGDTALRIREVQRGAKANLRVDFQQPDLRVNVLAKLVRRTNAAERLPDKTITVVEMLPSHDDLWLADHEGNRYTSELRCTWVDDRRLEATPPDSYGNFGA